jgi:hypothetical protein
MRKYWPDFMFFGPFRGYRSLRVDRFAAALVRETENWLRNRAVQQKVCVFEGEQLEALVHAK